MTLENHQTRRPSLFATLLVIVSMTLSFTSFARAENDQSSGGGEGISVAGSGEVKAKPKVVEINATVSGDAELAADAIVKYRDARRRAVDALNGLKLEGLKIDTNGFPGAQGLE